jgi:predicted amidophosphoribosyltransferase
VLDLLLPRRCVVCGVPGALACDACLARLSPVAPPLCARCGAPTAWPVGRCAECVGRRVAFATARSAVAYDDRARALVAAWKHRSLRGLAAPAAAVVAGRLEPPLVSALVPAPPDPERGLRRGHHPPDALAVELGRLWDLPVARLLERRHARPQQGLARSQRRRNAASVVAGGRAPARVALVDDVYTTGSTASAAASALRRGGAREVHVITLARALRDRGFG